MRFCWILFLTVTAAWSAEVKDIVARSIAASDRNWREAPHYVFEERDLEEKLDSRGKVKTRTFNTYEVMVLEGSEYRRMLRHDDKPLTPDEQHAENAKFEAEKKRRQSESAVVRDRRIGKYEKERQQDHAMMREMGDAFDYRIVGEPVMSGHKCWLLEATPKSGYVPKTRDTKVLTGMRGKMWVDQETYQWVRVEAEVTRPVSFYAVATVGPGTKFTLEQEPVGDGVWLPKRFAVKVNASVFFFAHNSLDDESYWGYKRVSGDVARKR